MTAILSAILDFRGSCRGFSRTFSLLFGPYFQSYPENFSLVGAISSIQILNDGHLGRHLEFLGKLQGDSPGLLLCYSAHISGATLKISACCELFQAYDRCFCLNDCHFGRHLGFLGQLQGDCPELLVCYSTDIPGPILKISASSELIQAYTCSLKMTAMLDAISWKLQGDSPGLLICCSTDFFGPILKISACYEKCPGFISF